MSSVLNHVPSRSGASSLRAASWLRSRPQPRDRCHNSLYPIYKAPLPSNASPGLLSSFRFLTSASNIARSDIESQGSQQNEANHSGGQFLGHSTSRTRHQSQLKQHYSPADSNRARRRNSGNEFCSEIDESPGAMDGKSVQLAKTKKGQRRQGIPSQNANQKPRRARPLPPTPTEYLNNALRNNSCRAGTARFPQCTGNLTNPGLGSMARKKKQTARKPRPSLQTILADYIQSVEPLLARASDSGIDKNSDSDVELNNALEEVFCENNLEYLTARNYAVADVVAWAWILKSNTVYHAILRIFMLQDHHRMERLATQSIPPFIPLLLLREQNLEAKTFRLLLVYCVHILSGQPLPSLQSSMSPASDGAASDIARPTQNTRPSIEATMCASFVARLLHHARQVWPQAQLTIARAFAYYMSLPGIETEESTLSIQRMDKLKAEKFNMCLWLLSLPSRIGPFASVSVKQQAQFELLKAMAGHKPVLPVTRRGYQGIIAVQLAHQKTAAEQQSAELKAPSWPPWKEEKLGIDFQRGFEGMKSRAMQVMSQMKEAGYSHSRWEEVCGVLAGWDTDQSPTIQTRSMVRRPASLTGSPASKPNDQVIWEARIRATRTVREAWACFLSYQERGLPPCRRIYAAMAEKLIFRRKAVDSHFDQISHALPGDGLEVFPEPSSARDLIYVPTEPPTLNEFLEQMLAEGIGPSGKFLGLLLRSAPSFNSGLNYLSRSDLLEKHVQALCTMRGQLSDYDVTTRKALNDLPDYLFSAFIEFLCKFSNFDRLYQAHYHVRTADLFPVLMGDRHRTHSKPMSLLEYSESPESNEGLHHPRNLSHAVQLVRLRSSRHPSAWIHLLSALSKDRISVPYRKMARSTQRVVAWHEIQEVIGLMRERGVDPGLQGFHILCISFSKAVMAGIKNLHGAEEGLELVSHLNRLTCLRFEDMVQAGLHILKNHFDQLVLPEAETARLFEGDKSSSTEIAPDSRIRVPPMLHVPSPAVLHAFVRALGLAEDCDGLLNLLRWMSQSANTLKEASDAHLNGARMMRRTLIAVRVFLEGPRQLSGPPGQSSLDDPEKLVFTDPNVQEAYDIVTATSGWGSWPSDEEVWDYVSLGT